VVRTLVFLAAGASLLAVGSGLLFASSQSFAGSGASLIDLHRNLEIGGGVLGLLAAGVAWRRPEAVGRALIGLVLLTAGLVATGAHFGGISVFGNDHFGDATPVAQPARVTSAKLDFWQDVRPILKKSCFRCHGRKKQKGGLRLDRKAAAMKGGEDGVVLVPGDPAESPLIQRLKLPRDHDDHMPAKGDPLTPVQIEVFERWVREGAVWDES
jgi:hypothetical protein